MASDGYSGDEVAVGWTGQYSPSGSEIFEVRPPQVRSGAHPVVDEESGLIAGYRYESGGFWMVWDLEGNLLEVGELPLEAPLIDPIDLLAGGLTGLGRGLFRSMGRGVIVSAGRVGMRALSTRVMMGMSAVLRKLIRPGSLKFTATTAARMATPGRSVPVHILHLAIRHGKQLRDPQGVIDAVKYITPMLKNGTEYTLEVVVRVRDSTVLHFLYK